MADNVQYWGKVNESINILGYESSNPSNTSLATPDVTAIDPNDHITHPQIDPKNFNIIISGDAIQKQGDAYYLRNNTQTSPTTLQVSLVQHGTTISSDPVALDIKIRAESMAWNNVNYWVFSNTVTENNNTTYYSFYPTFDNTYYHIPVIFDIDNPSMTLELLDAKSIVEFSPQETSEPQEYTKTTDSEKTARLFIAGSNETETRADWQSLSPYRIIEEITTFDGLSDPDIDIKDFIVFENSNIVSQTKHFSLDACYASQHIDNLEHTLYLDRNQKFIFDVYINKFNLESNYTCMKNIGESFGIDILKTSSDTPITNQCTIGNYSVSIEPVTPGTVGTLPLIYDDTTNTFTRVDSDLDDCYIVFTALGPTDISGNQHDTVHSILVACRLYYQSLAFIVAGMTTDTVTLYNAQGTTDWHSYEIQKLPVDAEGTLEYSYSINPPNSGVTVTSTGDITAEPGVHGIYTLTVTGRFTDIPDSDERPADITGELTLNILDQSL